MLGTFNNEPVFLKSGRYGKYISCGNLHVSSKVVDMSVHWEALLQKETEKKETIEKETIETIEKKENVKKNVKRILSTEWTICLNKNKKQHYLQYIPTNSMTPIFFSLEQFPNNPLRCNIIIINNWILHTYGFTV